MSRILLADDSPHAQRMGERILRAEGYDVITVSDGETAMLRLKDANPDLVIADVSMPFVTGYEICEFVKTSGKHPKTGVVLTVGAVEPLDATRAELSGADGVLKKPFEASLLLEAAQRLAGRVKPAAAADPASRTLLMLDRRDLRDEVRAAVTIALDATFNAMADQITDKVVASLASKAPGASPPQASFKQAK